MLVPLERDAAIDAPTGIGSDASLDGLTDAILANATWTNIYQTLLVNPSYASNCAGSACHDPGSQHGITFSSQAAGYTSARSLVVPGSPSTSTLIQVLQSGSMPRGRPPMAAADLELIRAWIQMGAMNN